MAKTNETEQRKPRLNKNYQKIFYKDFKRGNKIDHVMEKIQIANVKKET